MPGAGGTPGAAGMPDYHRSQCQQQAEAVRSRHHKTTTGCIIPGAGGTALLMRGGGGATGTLGAGGTPPGDGAARMGCVHDKRHI